MLELLNEMVVVKLEDSGFALRITSFPLAPGVESLSKQREPLFSSFGYINSDIAICTIDVVESRVVQ